jgi:hypothetical protein
LCASISTSEGRVCGNNAARKKNTVRTRKRVENKTTTFSFLFLNQYLRRERWWLWGRQR